ncbi:MAG: sigma-70 family RNA polymerase sigma factor [Flavobacteriaceae bacterium]|jgi:RNA polymerase sigma factor (sigma-70 family)|nr:sigma-70 family RNA polymerase sigma factor [Flavobacteriaceae bacterium]
MKNSDEDALISRAIAQDQQAFNDLFNKHWDAVFSYLLQRTQNEATAEEIAIETFAKSFDNIVSYNSKYNFQGWLITIAKNTQIDRYRKESNQQELEENIDDSEHLELASPNLNPEEHLISNQSLDRILLHIQNLKKEYRNILNLRYFEGMSYKEMGVVLDQPVNTIKVKLFRAKKMLASSIKNE